MVPTICTKRKHAFCIVFLAFITSGTAAAATGSCAAFVDVTVVHVDREREVPHQTVLVRDGRIAKIAPARKSKLPAGCFGIDGHDRYLIPGLIDSHVHLPLTGRTDQLLVLQMLLANGVTTGINMEGSPEILSLRKEIREGIVLAPD